MGGSETSRLLCRSVWWLLKELVGYSECSKCRPFALTQAHSRSPHWLCQWQSVECMTKSQWAAAWDLPLPDCLSTVQCACPRNFFNSLLAPCFVQLFSGHLSVNLFAVYIFKYKLFLSKSCPHRWIPCWLLTNTAVTSAVTNFRCHKLIAKVNK